MDDWKEWRDNIVGLGAQSARKSYYPELRKKLQELERFRSLLDESSEAVIQALATDGRILDANASACAFWNMEREQILGADVYELIPEPPLIALRDSIAATTGLSESSVLFRTGQQGGPHALEISAKVSVYEGEQYLVVICRDVSEHLKAEREIQLLNSDLERRVQERTAQLMAANQELEAFSYSVSHDLQAPLRAVVAYTGFLQRDYREALDEEGKSFLDRIDSSAARMGGLIEDLLHLAKVTGQGMERTQFDMSVLVQSAVSDLEKANPGRRVSTKIQGSVPAFADRRLVRVLVENLVGNAWKFSSRNPEACIEFEALTGGEKLVYMVKDNGVGFDTAYSDRLFRAFQRLHSDREFAGAGIGLATVRRIVRRHGGDVWAESEVGVGATFYFTLE